MVRLAWRSSVQRSRKQRVAAFAAALFVATTFIASAGSTVTLAGPAYVTSVGNPDCPHTTGGSGNYGSTACLLYVTAYLIESNFARSTMTMPDYLVAEGNHILHTLVAFSGVPCKSFVEQTYVYGYNYHAYYEFVNTRVDYNYYGGGVSRYQVFPDGVTSNNGGTTKFQTKYIGSALWQAWRDDSLRYQSPDPGTMGAGACIGQAGLEVSKRASPGIESTYISYTHNQNIYWYDSSMTFRGGWSGQYNWIDYPCDLGQVPPNCLNGTYYGDSQWADNKP